MQVGLSLVNCWVSLGNSIKQTDKARETVGKQAKPNMKPAQPNLRIAAPPNPLQPAILLKIFCRFLFRESAKALVGVVGWVDRDPGVLDWFAACLRPFLSSRNGVEPTIFRASAGILSPFLQRCGENARKMVG